MSEPKRRRTFREHVYDNAMVAMRPLTTIVERSSLIPTSAFLPRSDFPWIQTLEDNWKTIRAELDGVLVYHSDLPSFHEINTIATGLQNENWKSFFFYGFGVRSHANCARCPKTAELIAAIPGLATAFFSILGPGTRLPPHRGVWKGVIRYHLGLMVPEPAEACAIKLDGEVAHWREGESLVFDDTYEHSVWNDTKGTRVVLFLDVLRPCRAPGSWVNRAMMKAFGLTPFVRDSIRRHRDWERKFGERHRPTPDPTSVTATLGSSAGLSGCNTP